LLGPLVASSAMDLLEEIPLNSIVVAAKSRVLKAMISSGMKESDKRAPMTVKVTPEGKPSMETVFLRTCFVSLMDQRRSSLLARSECDAKGCLLSESKHCGLKESVRKNNRSEVAGLFFSIP
jgi:hypothetical protein